MLIEQNARGINIIAHKKPNLQDDEIVLIFEWNEKKAYQNIKKHGVSFEEATTVFGDPFSLTIYDPLHSKDEDRFVILSMSKKNRILVVV